MLMNLGPTATGQALGEAGFGVPMVSARPTPSDRVNRIALGDIPGGQLGPWAGGGFTQPSSNRGIAAALLGGGASDLLAPGANIDPGRTGGIPPAWLATLYQQHPGGMINLERLQPAAPIKNGMQRVSPGVYRRVAPASPARSRGRGR